MERGRRCTVLRVFGQEEDEKKKKRKKEKEIKIKRDPNTSVLLEKVGPMHQFNPTQGPNFNHKWLIWLT